jgi:hypothetical protein
MKQKRALHNKPHKTGRKGYRGKSKEWEDEDAKLAAEGKQNPWDQFSGCSRPYVWARVGKKRKNTSEGSGGITFINPAVLGVADRVKTLAAQGSDGSFSGVREDDILTTALETPQHRGRVRGVSSSLGLGNGFGEGERILCKPPIPCKLCKPQYGPLDPHPMPRERDRAN